MDPTGDIILWEAWIFKHTSPAHSQLVVGLAVNAALATKPEPSVKGKGLRNPHYIRCIWGWSLRVPSQGYHHFPYDYRVRIISMDSMHSQRFESYRFIRRLNKLTSMDFKWFLWTSSHFHGFHWTSMRFHLFLWTSSDAASDFFAFLWTSMDSQWFLWTSMDFYQLQMIWCLWTSRNVHEFPWVIYIYIYMDFYWLVIGGLLQTSLGFKCFLCTSHDLYGARWILNGFPLISLDFYGCLFRSVDFYVLQTVFCVHGGLSWSIFKKSSIHIYWFQMIFCWFLYEFCEGLCVSENFQGFL